MVRLLPGMPLLAFVMSTTSCDTNLLGGGESCPIESMPGHDLYFPLEDGDEIEYDYRSSSGPMWNSGSLRGILTWQVEGLGDCSDGTHEFLVRERLEGERRVFDDFMGDTTYAWKKERTLMFSINDTTVFLGPYVEEGLSRFFPTEMPDTIMVTLNKGSTIYSGPESGVRTTIQLARKIGMISRSYWFHAGASYDEFEDLVRMN